MEVSDRFLPPQVQLANAIREFLVDVNRLTRVYVARTLLNVGVRPTKAAVNTRLQNAAAKFRNLLVKYYGEDIANQIQTDFMTFINYFEQMVDAYAIHDQDAVAQYSNALYYLADKDAQSYALINNYFDKDVIRTLLYDWIALAQNQIVSIMEGNHERELEEYDQFMDITYRLADEFIYGTLRQFFYDFGRQRSGVRS